MEGWDFGQEYEVLYRVLGRASVGTGPEDAGLLVQVPGRWRHYYSLGVAKHPLKKQ